ncbi:AhpD family alkylhydroperoxidase [Spinactinospora alkalitolerans]|uniref:AhpD family alkylhydroperoxidase n=1 Tax=Spinactinospora alkalitolerans TaxID=687207 RepID=A0A852TVS4_9ACTN|nr:carboxymuconolactone decarboxylase family protein [Spinactinospora alkalitolerans]NYE47811.1 AhpD family alkylhydroperoxidase [Spinactinospora alkalitolerans]
MARIPVHTIDDAPEAARETLEALRRKQGKLLNIHAEMAHAPVVLAAYHGMQQAIAEHGSFDARTREAIALAVGAVDGCDYCQSAHTLGAKAAGMTLDQTVEVRSGEVAFDPELAALVTLARQITADRGDVDDSAWKAARQAGWSDTELTELFAHVAVNLYTNFFNHYAETELDVPPAPGLRH